MIKLANVLAFCGKSYTGKTKAAEFITKLDERFKRFSLTPLISYEFAKDFSVPFGAVQADVSLYKSVLFDYDMVKRRNNPTFFIEHLFEGISEKDFVVLDDLRFVEDLAFLVKNGAKIYCLHSENNHRKARGWIYNPDIDDSSAEHELNISADSMISATSGKGGIIYNTRDFDYLKFQLSKILAEHFPKEGGISPDLACRLV